MKTKIINSLLYVALAICIIIPIMTTIYLINNYTRTYSYSENPEYFTIEYTPSSNQTIYVD